MWALRYLWINWNEKRVVERPHSTTIQKQRERYCCGEWKNLSRYICSPALDTFGWIKHKLRLYFDDVPSHFSHSQCFNVSCFTLNVSRLFFLYFDIIVLRIEKKKRTFLIWPSVYMQNISLSSAFLECFPSFNPQKPEENLRVENMKIQSISNISLMIFPSKGLSILFVIFNEPSLWFLMACHHHHSSEFFFIFKIFHEITWTYFLGSFGA